KPFEVEAFLGSVEKARQRVAPMEPGGPEWRQVAQRYRLTRRQAEVLRAFYETGKTNRDLAEDLSLSPHTVKSHLKAAFLKVGVTSRAQLLQRLRERN
ncbi:MAG: helix-turn-helix transcriptional regulator, partial [Proteobacteria bacterium]|nr:helix-turn-helix transcriptional regulator [Pseudomonadota bacterium]